jgi:ABC-type amino acid transport substrate-binding protein
MGDLKVGVVKDDSGQMWSETAGLKPKTFANFTDTILALVKGEMDAIVMDEPVVGYLTAKYNFEDKIVRGMQVDQGRMILPVKKGNKVLLDILDKGVASISPEELRKISIKWFREAPICKVCQRKFQSLLGVLPNPNI